MRCMDSPTESIDKTECKYRSNHYRKDKDSYKELHSGKTAGLENISAKLMKSCDI